MDGLISRAAAGRFPLGAAARAPRAARGFTILEVMIVIGILAFGLLALSAMQLHAMQGSDRGRHASQAAALAEARMERLQNAAWTTIAPTGGFVTAVTESNEIQLADGGSPAERNYSVTHQIADLAATFTRTIDVRVSWTEKSGETRSVSLSCIRYNRERL
jgi:prepilin-type N-terminal cleavage/methylation domain-containing protein